ncbi:lysine N(6)-hydroxylase/L-ornithine N(5)-oxygenase family protein [Chryseobacterium oryctis]|uniref:SidA/IucD/PvdA family monooxygenase n=1 Tax=Chryseobacterium oryctis TaxID=2952618 RepID=A0ABT3HKI1_9FLAO|nr:SidA/IucD/PvdA family monooxygenase [Chryseobacterium oryctis]MCW3160295.1 SidA/IucD/PvdA family monooxygenase [Chryseobacterium oryctis]
MKHQIYDIIGIGIGPFNLGMAALADQLPLKTIFFDQEPSFDWHRGLMIEGSKLQVPFIADLVTSVEPTNQYSYLNYLIAKNRLFKFCIKETFYITRAEYNDYCKWVAAQLHQLHFSHRVESIEYSEKNGERIYEIAVHDLINRTTKYYYSKNLVVGTGTVPCVPKFAEHCSHERVFHSSQYTYRKKYIKPNSSISIIGSGQSAAEIFKDLLQGIDEKELKLNWITEADRFYPMENSKLTFEHTSPDYLSFFHSLSDKKRHEIVNNQDVLYKGINQELIDAIYDDLYELDFLRETPLPVTILANTRLQALEGDKYSGFEMFLKNKVVEKSYQLPTDYVILATGYKHHQPQFLNGIDDLIRRDSLGNWRADEVFNINSVERSLYILNAELTSHGILTADLGMGPYRNAVILNDILGYGHFKLEQKIAFQDFGVPKKLELSRA